MKNRLTTVSIVGNVALLGGLLWMRTEREAEVRNVSLAAMRGDELHLQLHARSLAALESADTADVAATAAMLRAIISAGEANIELRQRLGLGR